jgi:hypothetical protein
MNSETRRLNKLKDTNRNLAKLPELAVKIIEKNGKVHGAESTGQRLPICRQSEYVGTVHKIMTRCLSRCVPLLINTSLVRSGLSLVQSDDSRREINSCPISLTPLSPLNHDSQSAAFAGSPCSKPARPLRTGRSFTRNALTANNATPRRKPSDVSRAWPVPLHRTSLPERRAE